MSTRLKNVMKHAMLMVYIPWGVGVGTPYEGLYGETLSFFRLSVYTIFQVEVYER